MSRLVADLGLERPGGGFRLEAAFDLPAGLCGLHGPSGGGKTTLLRCLAGLEATVRGRLSVDGEAWLDGARSRPVHRRETALVFQDGALFEHLDVEGNLLFGRRRRPGTGGPDPTAVAERLGLASLLKRRVQGLSGGERQRVALGRALLARPRLLLLDEPLASLDQRARRELLPLLGELVRELDLPALFVSHDADELLAVSDRLLLLEGGRIVGAGPTGRLAVDLTGPLTRRESAAAVLEAVVLATDAALVADGLLALRLLGPAGEPLPDRGDGPRLLLPGSPREPGERLRLRLPARDLSLALDAPAGSSLLNSLPARVEDVVDEGPGTCLVRMQCGPCPLLARITRRSRRLLELRPGLAVHAQVKGVALAGPESSRSDERAQETMRSEP